MKSLTSAFNNLKVNVKIMLGFAAVLLILVAVAFSGHRTLVALSGSFDTYAESSDRVGTTNDIDRELLSMRRFVRDYYQSGDKTNIAKVNEIRPALVEKIGKGLKEITDPSDLAIMKEISDLFEKYMGAFDKLVALRTERDARVADVLVPVGQKSLAMLTDVRQGVMKLNDNAAVVLAATAMEQMLYARLNVTKILYNHDWPLMDAIKKSFGEVDAAVGSLMKLPSAVEYRDALAEIAKLAQTYHTNFADVTEQMHSIDTLVDLEMKATADSLGEKAAHIRTGALEEQKQIGTAAAERIATSQNFALILSVGGLLLGAALAFVIGRTISKPIRAIADVLLKLAGGNKAVDVPYADRGDEVGENARAAQIFKENLIRIEKMETEQKEAEKHAAERRKADMRRMADEFQKAVGGIVDTVSQASSQLESAAVSLTGTASSTQSLSSAVAAASEQTSANVQGVAAASEQLSSTVTEISRQVQESSSIAREAVSQAAKTTDCVSELSQSADRIGDVIGLINTIAGQTNLLALNATIEAARAGDAGKGFAVVAQEVKALAAQTGKATDEIGAQIAGMQTATKDAVAAIQQITTTINRMSEISGAIAAAVEEQGATTQEISRNVTEAAKGTAEVASNITEVSRGAGETGTASSQVLSSAKSLSSQSHQLKGEVDKFLSTVRAA